MKVLLLCDRLDAGGVETHIASLARELARLGVEVTLASGGGRMAEALLGEGFDHIPLPLPTHRPLSLLRARLQIKGLVRAKGFHILHAHTRLTALLLRGCEKWRNPDGSHPRSAVTAHACFGGGPLLRRLSHWGGITLAVSEDIAHALKTAYRVTDDRLAVIPNGIDLSLFSPPARPPEPSPIRLLFASRLDGDCSLGAHLLLSLLPRLVSLFSIRLTLTGGGDEYEALQRRAEEINRTLGSDAVTLTGHTADMPRLLREHHIFVGVSRAAMEAAAVGLAVILCGNEGYGGILTAESAPHALLSNFCARGEKTPTADRLFPDLCRLLGDSQYRRRVSLEGRLFVRSRLNCRTTALRTCEMYQKHLQMPLRVLICGYVGCGNSGDDTMLRGILQALRRLPFPIEPWVLTGGGREDREGFGVRCSGRKVPLSILRVMIKCDLLLMGGGSLLQSISSRSSLWYYLSLLRAAPLLGCTPVLYGAGIGPFAHPEDAKKATRVLKKLPHIGVREDSLQERLAAMGIDPAALHTGGDPALLLWEGSPSHPPQEPPLYVLVAGGASEARMIALFLPFCREAAKGGASVILLSLCRRDDRAAKGAAERLQLPFFSAARHEEVLSLLSATKGLLSLRLHGLVFAAMAGVPALGVTLAPGEEKLSAFAAALEQGHVNGASADPALFFSLLSRISPPDPARIREMAKKAEKDLENILSMVYNNKRCKKNDPKEMRS